MREILFRGKRIDNGEWVEGYFCKWPCVSWKVLSCVIVPVIGLENGIAEQAIVYPSTVGQWTGLIDKNGKRIFAGDILRQKKNGVYGLPFSVVFDDGGFMWNENGRRDFLYQSICDTCEVIGTIYDNSELMEGD